MSKTYGPADVSTDTPTFSVDEDVCYDYGSNTDNTSAVGTGGGSGDSGGPPPLTPEQQAQKDEAARALIERAKG